MTSYGGCKFSSKHMCITLLQAHLAVSVWTSINLFVFHEVPFTWQLGPLVPLSPARKALSLFSASPFHASYSIPFLAMITHFHPLPHFLGMKKTNQLPFPLPFLFITPSAAPSALLPPPPPLLPSPPPSLPPSTTLQPHETTRELASVLTTCRAWRLAGRRWHVEGCRSDSTEAESSCPGRGRGRGSS